MKRGLQTVIVVSIAVILLAGGIWLAGHQGPSDVSETTSTPPRVVPEAWEAREADSASQQDTDSATADNADETEQNAGDDAPTTPGDGETPGVAEGGSSSQADESTASESGHEPSPPARTSRQVGEEEFINLSVDIIVTAMAMKNSGEGPEALQEYTVQLLEDRGFSPAGFEEATQQIVNDEQQAQRVTREILQRVRVKTGVQMDMRVIPLLNPGLKEAVESSDGGIGKPSDDASGE
ncbi:MAG: hypothetical protein ACLFWB_00640 [Armatimonadota bacterium]